MLLVLAKESISVVDAKVLSNILLDIQKEVSRSTANVLWKQMSSFVQQRFGNENRLNVTAASYIETNKAVSGYNV